MSNFKSIGVLVCVLCLGLEMHAAKYGNYKDSRIGDIDNQTFEALLYFPDKEWMFDFDTDTPLAGVNSDGSSFIASTDFYMSKSQSLKWNASADAYITFDANIKLSAEHNVDINLSLGIFQTDVPEKSKMRVFKVECLLADNAVINTRLMHLRKGGWNILCSELTSLGSGPVSKVKITQVSGEPGVVYLDNVMLFAMQNSFNGVATMGIEEPTLSVDNAPNYPTKALTEDERIAFNEILERILPSPTKISSLSSSEMQRYRDFYATYDIDIKGDYATGMNPLFYWRWLIEGDANNTLQYTQNQEMNQTFRNMGYAWSRTQDAAQRDELGEMIVGLYKLAITYGGMPFPWYNGRGFAEGVAYSKELLQDAGILDELSSLVFMQYNMGDILFNEHKWDHPLAIEHPRGPTLFWNATADNLNTTSLSTFLSLLIAEDTPEKARNLYRLKSWLDNIALTYSPNTLGTLKPDGSWYHHWGNRWDNYGWVAAWRGATENVWWLSHTPFSVADSTLARMHHMADIHFKVMNKDGYVGPQDAMMYVPSEGFLNLARAGSVDGVLDIDSVMAGYWLAFPKDRTYTGNANLVNQYQKSGFEPAKRESYNITMGYDVTNIHRTGNWQVYTRGVAKDHYHTQYKRNGFLFYNIGGISLCKEGEQTGLQNVYGGSVMLRSASDEVNITSGYNFSRAPGVTSVNTSFDKLKQLYYQAGSSKFVGGVSTGNSTGVFVQNFYGSGKYSGTVASALGFKKSYFFFGDDIVAIASGLSKAGSFTGVETGLLQESTKNNKNVFKLANSESTDGSSFNQSYQSGEVTWLHNSTLKMGVYLSPGQDYKVFKGEQSFGTSQGPIVSAYIDHSVRSNDWYEFVLRLNVEEAQMISLDESMSGSDPEYKVIQRDNNAHIVYSKKTNSTGYAIFNPEKVSFIAELIHKVNKPCVVMKQILESGSKVVLSVADPDKHMDKTTANPLGWSLPSNIEIVVNGEYTLDEKSTGNAMVTYDAGANQSTVAVTVKDGLTLEVILERIKAGNTKPIVLIRDLKVTPDSITLYVDETYTLTATYLPKNALDSILTWRSVNNDIASVNDKGLVTAKQEGEAVILVVNSAGTIVDTCHVHVLDKVNRIVNTQRSDDFIWLYPNPAKSIITIENQSDEVINTIELYHINGTKISERNNQSINKNESIYINLNELKVNKGIYLIRVGTGNNQVRVSKFFVQ